MKNILSLTLLLSLLFFSCGKQQPSIQERPRKPFVFRSNLDGFPQMISVALHKNLWLAYEGGEGNLYKAWNGKVLLEGAAFNAQKDVQPISLGGTYFENGTTGNRWKLEKSGKEETYQQQFEGYVVENNEVTFRYSLLTSSGAKILVEEKPEYLGNLEGQSGLERTFIVKNVPEGLSISYYINLSSIASGEHYSTNGEFKKIESGEGNLTGILKLNIDSSTTFSAIFNKVPSEISSVNSASLLMENVKGNKRGKLLTDKLDCSTCHNKNEKIIGPSYDQIAEKYEFGEENIQQLVQKIISGGSGVWGQTAMNAHPDLEEDDAVAMVKYISSLKQGKNKIAKLGLAVSVFELGKSYDDFPKIISGQEPNMAFPVSSSVFNKGSLKETIPQNSLVNFQGFLQFPEIGAYEFRLASKGLASLKLNGENVLKTTEANITATGEVNISKEKARLVFEYYNQEKVDFELEWRKKGESEFTNIPTNNLSYQDFMIKKTLDGIKEIHESDFKPGFGQPLNAMHPAYDILPFRNKDFEPRVSGMSVLPDGDLVICTWDSLGAVYRIKGTAEAKDSSEVEVKMIASGLAEPLGLTVVDGSIFVLQKHELTQLIDLDGDEIIEEYKTICNSWTSTTDFHEFAFGLVHKDGYFYANLSIAMRLQDGEYQEPDRGKTIKIGMDGSYETICAGLRQPNGIGLGPNGEIVVTDNQGQWAPGNKFIFIEKDAFYGCRHHVKDTPEEETPPTVWLPQGEIGNSPGEPFVLQDGIYKGQMAHGDVTNGGIKRVFVEEVNGQFQGCVFRFMQGLEAGIHRNVYGKDGALYVGGIGMPGGNWAHDGKIFGLQKLKFNGKSVFEMLAVRAQPNGVEIEFTEPISESASFKNLLVKQWFYLSEDRYGGPKRDLKYLDIRDFSISADRKKVLLNLDGMEAGRVIYIRLPKDLKSESGNALWSSEVWYTMNEVPINQKI